jgi:hypothetical protein
VAKDSEKTPAQILNQIRKEWGFEVDEPTAKAQAEALVPLQKWLSTGVESPDVVIRSVQVLLADPEIPGLDQRSAIQEVSQAVAETWRNSGQGPQGVLGLQALILAAWPHEKRQGGFALTSLLDSAWPVIAGRDRCRPRINAWRESMLERTAKGSPQIPAAPKAVKKQIDQLAPLKVTTPDWMQLLERLRVLAASGRNHGTDQVLSMLETHKTDLTSLAGAVGPVIDTLNTVSTALEDLKSQISAEMARILQSYRAESEFLWWGQARYSQSRVMPYRRIKDPDERLWWMAWESSELAVGLDVEPAASFLVETLIQVGDDINEKRPLKDWIRRLVPVLRRTYQDYSLSKKLAELASEDALGLPVTWACLEAANSERQDATLEERARAETGLNLDVGIDRGEWAAWVFREVLLDRHLGED